jgi:hypothetical protein
MLNFGSGSFLAETKKAMRPKENMSRLQSAAKFDEFQQYSNFYSDLYQFFSGLYRL